MALPPYFVAGPNAHWAAAMLQQQQQANAQLAALQAQSQVAAAQAHAVQMQAAQQSFAQQQSHSQSSGVPPPKVPEYVSEEKLQEKGVYLPLYERIQNFCVYLYCCAQT